MDTLNKFLEYHPTAVGEKQEISAKNELKLLSKQLLKASKGSNGPVVLAALCTSISSLIPPQMETISSVSLSKLTFMWQTFPSTHTHAVAGSLLQLIAQVLRNCTETHITDYSSRVQLVLGLLLSICHPSEKIPLDTSQQQLQEIQRVLELILFHPNVENVEVCALSGTAWCNIIYAMDDDLMSKYDILYSRERELKLGHIALSAGVLILNKVAKGKLPVNAGLLKASIISQCTCGVNDYHAFSCLLKFLQSSLFVRVIQDEPSFVSQELITLLWAHCDSSVQGVGEFVVSCYRIVLSTAHKYLTDSPPLHVHLLDKLLPMPWNVKAKLKLLPVLVPWLDTSQLVRSNPTMVTDISKCLSAQYLAAAAGKLYLSLIQQIDYDTWVQVVMEQFIQALTSPVKLIRYNTRHYWLPSTLTRYPECKQLLIQELSAHPSHMAALIAVYRVCRKLSALKELHVDHLQRALLSSDDEMRADVLSLICVSNPSDGVSEAEIELVENALLYNLNIDCPTFRHQLISAMHSWMTRLAYHLNYQTMGTERMIIGHIHFIWSLCTRSVVRGSNYQRKETVLKLTTLLLSTLSDLSQNESTRFILHSTICSESSCNGTQHCPTLARFKQQIVNVCLLDSSSEIQDLGYKLLSLQVTPQFYPLWGSSTASLLDNLELWRYYITRAKASEAESGALIYTLIVSMSGDEKFVQDQIIDPLDRCICAVETDNTLMASSPHVYGYLVALQRIFQNTSYLSSLNSKHLRELGLRLIDICQRTVNAVLEVFMSTVPNKDVSPSFEHVEEAIEKLVQTAQGNNSIGDDILGVTDRVSAWCWLSLKEACCLCGTISRCSIIHKDLLLPSAVDTVRDLFYSTLTKCRHRGVIEGSSAGLTQFIQTMLQNSYQSCREVPYHIINQVLDTTIREDKVVSSCSVTRRSGGFPIIIQSVLSAENKCKRSTLLNMTVCELLKSCDQLATIQQDETTDMPQVHALNMLKALVVDAVLAGVVRCYIARITIVCIECFTSPLWALRNAATQLFASCTQRMIGQKRQSEGTVVGTSCVELFSQYPALYDFMLDRLRRSDPSRLNAEIFPILNLLSLLSPCTLATEDNEIMKPYQEVLMEYMANPIHVVRRLTSLSIVATIGSLPELCSLAEQVVEAIFTEKKANIVHAQLLTLQVMVKQLNEQQHGQARISTTLNSIAASIRNRVMWFLSSCRCHVLISNYLQLLVILCDNRSPPAELEHWLVSLLTSPSKQMPGEAELKLTCCKILSSVSNFELLFSLLDTVEDSEIKQLLLDRLITTYTSEKHSRVLQQWISCHLLDTTNRYHVENLLALLLNSFKHSGVHVDGDMLSNLLVAVDKSSPSHLLLAVYTRTPTTHGKDCSTIQALYKACQPGHASHMTSSIVCECVAAVISSYERLSFTEEDSIQMLSTLLSLLQDECTETRLKAAQSTAQLLHLVFAEELSSIPDDLHYNIALQKVLRELPRAMGVSEQRWAEWMYSIIHDNINHYMNIYSTARKSQMFFQEEDNSYYERSVITEIVCSLLMEARNSGIATDFQRCHVSLDGESFHLRGLVQSFEEVKSFYYKLCKELALCQNN